MSTNAVLSFAAARARLTANKSVMPKTVYAEKVTEVERYTDGLFRLRVRRPRGLRFRSGEFVMIGLPGAPMRAHSIASPNWGDDLDFVSVTVPGGPLSERLARTMPGDTLLVGRESAGTLVNDALEPGRRLFLFATGTGIAPFASLIRDPETYDKFDEIVLTQTCRTVAELEFAERTVAAALADPLLGEFIAGRLRFFTSTTRETHFHTGRITTLLRSGALYQAFAVPPLCPARDRAMICGSVAMVRDTQAILETAGFVEGTVEAPGSFVVERAFADPSRIAAFA